MDMPTRVFPQLLSGRPAALVGAAFMEFLELRQ
jgi:hypothetical protein